LLKLFLSNVVKKYLVTSHVRCNYNIIYILGFRDVNVMVDFIITF